MNTHFSSSVKEIISHSLEEAQRLHSNTIGPGHLLLALLKEAPLTREFRLKNPEALPKLQKEIEETIARETEGADIGKARVFQKRGLIDIFRRRPNPVGISLSRQAERVIREAVSQARVRQSPQVEPLHLADAFLKDNEHAFTKILARYRFDQA